MKFREKSASGRIRSDSLRSMPPRPVRQPETRKASAPFRTGRHYSTNVGIGKVFPRLRQVGPLPLKRPLFAGLWYRLEAAQLLGWLMQNAKDRNSGMPG